MKSIKDVIIELNIKGDEHIQKSPCRKKKKKT